MEVKTKLRHRSTRSLTSVVRVVPKIGSLEPFNFDNCSVAGTGAPMTLEVFFLHKQMHSLIDLLF